MFFICIRNYHFGCLSADKDKFFNQFIPASSKSAPSRILLLAGKRYEWSPRKMWNSSYSMDNLSYSRQPCFEVTNVISCNARPLRATRASRASRIQNCLYWGLIVTSETRVAQGTYGCHDRDYGSFPWQFSFISSILHFTLNAGIIRDGFPWEISFI